MIVAAVYPLDMVLLSFDLLCSWCRFMVWFCNYDIGQHIKSTGLEIIKLEYRLKLKIKRNDWLLADTCPKTANHCAFFEFENELKFYNLES